LHEKILGSPSSIFALALSYLAAGLSVIPVRTDGSKAPRIPDWRVFSDRRPTASELREWFACSSAGIGILGGPASGNLVVFDFEEWVAFQSWGDRLSGDDRSLLASCPVVRTPSGGAHVYCRLAEPVRGARYAKDAVGECLIETRGDGQFVVAPGLAGLLPPEWPPLRAHA